MNSSVPVIAIYKLLLEDCIFVATEIHETGNFRLDVHFFGAIRIMVIGEFSIGSLLHYESWGVEELSVCKFNSTLLKVFKLGDNKGIVTHLVSEGFLGFVCSSNLFKETWSFIFSHAKAWHVLASYMSDFVVTFNIAVKVPDEDSVVLAYSDDLTVVSWVEHETIDLICMPNEALEVIWYCLLGLVVPDLDHVVFSASKHVA